ncbi:MAG TPA: efflux RND transporter periplasmic adaptor subunit, partial [Gemmatimonadales bacterium]|nr:efflux RND transporter periplasmic adaptor subunit [Gemmatimonadales bacterium]
MRRPILIALALVAAAVAVFWYVRGRKPKEAPLVYQAVPVERRSIVVSARAAGTVQPDTVVEVKSKASGEILEMRAETGQLVQRGQLLVRVDQRAVRNAFNQAQATLEVARARLTNAEAQWKRAEELYKSQSVSQQEYEAAQLAVANAKAEVVRAEIDVENARIQMDDTDVRAPITGTIISKTAERGQVISSPTRDVGGGTVLLKMADLNLVQVRTLVDETDIGKIQPGLRATVTVDAYPNQPFQGEVLKIEPQAETAQNVTMFPVLIRIENRNALLKPGMNTDVEVHIGRRDSVMAVPNAALRTQRDVASAAQVLGIGPDRLETLLADAQKQRDSLQATLAANRPREGGDTARTTPAAQPRRTAGANTMTTPDGRTVELPAGVTEAQVRELMRKRFQGGELTAAESATLQRVMAGFRRSGGGAGRNGGAGRTRSTNDFQFGGNYIVFVLRNGQPLPVYVRTGLTDLDYSEVVT